jgi:hypothetical protein
MTARGTGRADPAGPMVRLLRSPIRHLLPRTMVLLRYVSATGATVTLPVQAAQEATRLVVLVGHADKKRWWRHFRRAAAADVWLDGSWYPAVGEVSPANGEAASLYRRRFPRVAVPDNATLVDLRCDAIPR